MNNTIAEFLTMTQEYFPKCLEASIEDRKKYESTVMESLSENDLRSQKRLWLIFGNPFDNEAYMFLAYNGPNLWEFTISAADEKAKYTINEVDSLKYILHFILIELQPKDYGEW